MPKNSKGGWLGSLNVFFTNWKLQKNARGTLWKNSKIFEKSRIVPKKNPKGTPFGLSCNFWKHKNLWFSARIEPTLSSLVEEIWSKLNKWTNCKKSGPLRVRLSAEKETRQERLKSALYLRLKKRKRLFFEKTFKFSKIFPFRNTSHSAEKCKRGTLFDL